MLSSIKKIYPPQYSSNITDLPILGFAAYSGSGKTTLLTEVIALLKLKKLRIGIIKHSHHDIELDDPKKDSYKLRYAGAEQLSLTGPIRIIHFTERTESKETSLWEAINTLNLDTLDLILVEGFRHEPFTKIEIHRPSQKNQLLSTNDPNIIAIATDEPTLETNLPLLDLNKPSDIAEFILRVM